MKNYAPWIILGTVALFVLGLFGGMLLPIDGIGCANGYGMMGGWKLMPWGFIGMVLMWLIPPKSRACFQSPRN